MLCPICAQENEISAISCRSCGAPLAGIETSRQQFLAVGATLQYGTYEVTGLLGRGGFGIVYEGRDVRLKRRVAIKEFLAGEDQHPARGADTAAAHAALRQQFLEEAQLLARFTHPNIINVHTVFEENGTVYMVTEFLEGRSLQRIVETDRALGEETALAIVAKVCDALEVIHGEGVLHRDIKPENIVRCLDGRIVLIDFGIAREVADSDRATEPVTLSPGYAPLEQYSAQAKWGVYTDIYALGATLYFLLTGKTPLDAATRARSGELSPPNALDPSISPQVNKAIMWAMAMRIEDRPESARAWIEALYAKPSWSGEKPPPPLVTAPVATNLPTRILAGHSSAVTAVAFSADGRHVGTGGIDHTVNIWDTATWSNLRKYKHTDRITGLTTSATHNLLISAGFEGTMNSWDFATGNLVREMSVPLLTQLFVTYSSTESMTMAPDGETLFTATGSIMGVWNIREGQFIRHMRKPVTHVAISPDGALLACCVAAGNKSSVELWDANDDRVLFTIAKIVRSPTALAFSPDNRHLGCGLSDGSVFIWDLQDKKLSRSQNSGQSVNALTFSPNGKMLASAGANGTVYLWRATEAGLLDSFPAHDDAINALAFSPDSTLLVTASSDSTAKVWRIL